MPADTPATGDVSRTSRRPTRVAVVFGGRSTEHSISCLSAGTVRAALSGVGYDVVSVGVNRAGGWVLASERQAYSLVGDVLPEVVDGEPVSFNGDATAPGLVTAGGRAIPVDVVFPVLHGRYGEDGTVQGLLEMAGVPYVGSGVYSSAASMDKAHMKMALRSAGLPVADYEVVRPGHALPGGVLDRLGSPVFVKPASGGSSIGITKVRGAEQLPAALQLAAESDPKVLIESSINGREIECGVLAGPDGGRPLASVPAEVTVAEGVDFYDFNAKYLSDATTFTVPADLPIEVTAKVQRLAIEAYEALDCAGLARVDVFVQPDGSVVVNELNTMPGFTNASMYPRMWAATGVDLPELVDRLVLDALARGAGR
jgi:D-alanine-D-alanine ligase